MTDDISKRNKNNRLRSKSQERKDSLKYWFVHRTPGSGMSSRHTSSDTLSTKFYVEMKGYAKFRHHSLFHPLVKHAKQEKKIPVLHTRETGKQLVLVTVRADDLEEFCREYLIEKRLHEEKEEE